MSNWLVEIKYSIQCSKIEFFQEIAEPLMDLKNGIKSLKENVTLRRILEILLAVGNYLNGVEVNHSSRRVFDSYFFWILVCGIST